MTTVAERPPVTTAPLQHLVLHEIGWDQFVTITDALGERNKLRIAYDGESLEFMTTSRRHERYKKLLGQLLEQLTFELDIPRESGGQTTFRSEYVHRGLEPDQCYWIQHAEEIIGVDDWEAGVHPPPDLALEIDVTRSALDRPAIYAALGVPELWRCDGESLSAFQLTEGAYEAIEYSLALPSLKVADLLPFLQSAGKEGETAILRRFVEWVRAQPFSG